MTITGHYDETGYGVVTVDGAPLSPARSQAVWNHSPDGFGWGYGGSGPAQLALAILLEGGVPPGRAVLLHQRFKWDFIAALSVHDTFTLEVDVLPWVARVERELAEIAGDSNKR